MYYGYICNWIWEKPASIHIYKYVEIQFWNINSIYVHILRGQRDSYVGAYKSFPLVYNYTISFSEPTTCIEQLAELPTILDSFCTSTTNDYIHRGGGWQSWESYFIKVIILYYITYIHTYVLLFTFANSNALQLHITCNLIILHIEVTF